MIVGRCGRGLVLASMLVAAAACGSRGGESTAGPAGLTVATPLADMAASGSERAKLEALLGVVRAKHPGIDITVVPFPPCLDASCSGPIPDVIEISGNDALRFWTEKGALESIDSLGHSERWENVMSQGVLQGLVGADAHLYGVPLEVARDNPLFFNRDLLAAANVS